MEFQHHASQHSQIREMLSAAIVEQASVDGLLLRSPCHCEVGRWLGGEGARRWAGHHAFLGLNEAHREFHACAGQVAELINGGDYVEAQRALRSGSRFSLALADLASAFRRMKAAAELVAV